MSIRIVISDTVLTGHPETVRASILLGYGAGLTADEIEIRADDFATDLAYALSIRVEAFVRSTTGIQGCIAGAEGVYPYIQCFMPLGSNSYIPLTLSPDEIPVIVTCGAGDTKNDTAYGNGLEFWDNDNDADPGVDASSYSNGTICGKLLKIKDSRSCRWWEARYSARMTASNSGVWDIYNGYGQIDTADAIAYTGAIIADPYFDNNPSESKTNAGMIFREP